MIFIKFLTGVGYAIPVPRFKNGEILLLILCLPNTFKINLITTQ